MIMKNVQNLSAEQTMQTSTLIHTVPVPKELDTHKTNTSNDFLEASKTENRIVLDHCENDFLKKSSKELCAKPKHRIVKNYGIENCTQIQPSKNLTPCRKIICPYENNCDSFIPPSEKSYVEKKENSALCKQTKFNSEGIK